MFFLLEFWVLLPAAGGIGFPVGSAPALLYQGPGSVLLSFGVQHLLEK